MPTTYTVQDGLQTITGNTTAEIEAQLTNSATQISPYYADSAYTTPTDPDNMPYIAYAYTNSADDQTTLSQLINGATSGLYSYLFDTIIVRGTNQEIFLTATINVTATRSITLEANDPTGNFITIDPSFTGRHLNITSSLDLTLIDVQFQGNNGSDQTQTLQIGGGFSISGSSNTVTLTGENTIQAFSNITNCCTNGDGGSIGTSAATTLAGNLILSNNRATGYGGGAVSSTLITIQDEVLISFNYSNGGGGGGVHVSGGNFFMSGGIIDSNYTAGSGGAVSNMGSATSITMTGGTLSNNTGGNGGGINSNGIINLSGPCLITGNTARNAGGGILQYYGANITISGITISGNTTSGNGGGIAYSIGGTGTNLTITDTTITGNIANGQGGGVYFSSGTATVTNSAITQNKGSSGGGFSLNSGTFYLDTNTDGTPTGTSTTITTNTATQNGGGIYQNSGTATLTSTMISGNTGAQSGGGIYQNNGTLNLIGTEISGHTTTSLGGGIYLQGSSILNISALSPDQPTTIHDNTSLAGGGIYSATSFSSSVTNLTIDSLECFNNRTTRSTVNTAGGGGICIYSGAGVISNSHIYNNITNANNQSGGGGIFSNGNGAAAVASLVLTNSLIEGNQSSLGGGLVNFGLGTVTVSGTTFTNNTAISTYTNDGGGGIFICGGTATLSDCEISNNTATWSGGGLCIHAGSKTVNADNLTIFGNTARYGGGVSVENSPGSTPVIASLSNFEIYNNQSATNGYGGGVAIISASTTTFSDSQIHDNTAPLGGGIYQSAGTLALQATVLATNTATATSGTNGTGGAIYTTNYQNLTTDATTTFSNNTAQTNAAIISPADLATYQANILTPTADWSLEAPYTSAATGYNNYDINYAQTTLAYYVYDGTASIQGTIPISATLQTDLQAAVLSQIPSNVADFALATQWYTDTACTVAYDFTQPLVPAVLYTYDNVADDQTSLTNLLNGTATGVYSQPFDTVLVRGSQIDQTQTVVLSSAITVANTRTAVTLEKYNPNGGYITLATGNTARHFNSNYALTITFIDVQLQGNNPNFLKNTNVGGGITLGSGAASNLVLTGANTIENFINITNCNAPRGGAILANGSDYLTLNGNITISGNYTSATGGAIMGYAGLILVMNDGILNGNGCSTSGGGIYLTGGSFQFNGGQINNNIGNLGMPAVGGNGSGVTLTNGCQMTMTDGEINGNNNGGVFVYSGSTFNFENGAINDNTGQGGILIMSNSTLNMTSGTVNGNAQTTSGGGIWVYDTTSTANISGGVITQNTSLNGGGITNQGTLNLTGGSFSHNTATQNGGGIYNTTTTCTITIPIIYNTAQNGGGIYSTANLNFPSGLIFQDNTATQNGGGLYSTATTTIQEAYLTYNVAASGGAIYNTGNLSLSNQSQILQNNASQNGGGIYNLGTATLQDTRFVLGTAQNGAGVYNGGTFTISGDSQFDSNTASGDGGGIFTTHYQNLTVSPNTQFVGNTAATSSDAVSPTDAAIYATNITTTTDWSLTDVDPTAPGYNNYDINYPLMHFNYQIIDGTDTPYTGTVAYSTTMAVDIFNHLLTQQANQLDTLLSSLDGFAISPNWYLDAACTNIFDPNTFDPSDYTAGMIIYNYDNVADDQNTLSQLVNGATSGLYHTLFDTVLVRGSNGSITQSGIITVADRTLTLEKYFPTGGFLVSPTGGSQRFHLTVTGNMNLILIDVQFLGRNADPKNPQAEGGGLNYTATAVATLIANNTLENFATITNCNPWDGFAGLNNAGTLTASNLIVQNNVAANWAGGVISSGTLHLINSKVQNNNSVQYGWGSGLALSGTAHLQNCEIFGNTATQLSAGYGRGGGMQLGTGTFFIEHCQIHDNATSYGGGIYLDGGTLQCVGTSITNNQAIQYQGGGVRINSGTAQFVECTIDGNTTPSNGGGVYLINGDLTLQGTTISNHQANLGGGIYHQGGTVTIQGSIFSNNTATTQTGTHGTGGAIYTATYANLTIDNASTFTGNTTAYIATSVLSADAETYAQNIHVPNSEWSLAAPPAPLNAPGYNNYDINYQDLEADLQIDLAIDTDPITPGRPVTYTLTVTNNGTTTAESPTVAQAVDLINPIYTTGDNRWYPWTGALQLPDMASGQVAVITIQPIASIADTIPSEATATISSFTSDVDPTNNASAISQTSNLANLFIPGEPTPTIEHSTSTLPEGFVGAIDANDLSL